MFHILEGALKKGSNTVCNLVRYVIEKEFEQNHYQKIFLYSDAAGGQNRNYLLVLYFLGSPLNTKLKFSIYFLYEDIRIVNATEISGCTEKRKK